MLDSNGMADTNISGQNMFIRNPKILALLSVSVLAAQAHAQGGAAAPPTGTGVQHDSLGVAYSQYLWPKAPNGVPTVYYTIDADSDPNATAKINAAIMISNNDFKNVLQWVPWTSADGANYVDIDLSADDTTGVCEANEGYEAIPAQPMSGSTDCTLGTILHEMGHVIGLWHEQSRPDRDSYITVNYDNVIKGSWSNFEIISDDQQILSSYDYASVMQYIPYAFTRNGGAVIESIPAGIPLGGYEGVPAFAGATGTPALPNVDYSAGDKETIERLYGAPPTQVTVTSNPIGLNVIVDGVSVITPQSYAWPLFSSHTLDVPSTAQTVSGDILNSNPAVAETFYYTYGRWSDSTEQSHTILVAPGNGSGPFPTTTPQVATYSANFIQLVPYSTTLYPAGTGQAAVSPLPQSYDGITGEFLVARQQATLSATANGGWNFYSFNNGPFWLQGGLGANPKTFDVPDTGDPINTTVYFSNTPIYTVDVQPESFSSNLSAYVDSEFVYTPKNYSQYYDKTWKPGSSHALRLESLQSPYSINSRYHFTSWSDGGALSHRITSLPAVGTDYVATVTPEFAPATNFDYPPCGGSAVLTPASPTKDGFYPTGRRLTFTATPAADSGWVFAGWTYDLTGTTNPRSLVADDETLVFANFNTVDAPLTLTAVSPGSVDAGAAAFVLTLTGTGFAPGSYVSANGQYRTVTYVNSKKLQVQMTAADVASPGAFQVFVKNYPQNWTGCAVFGYQTFIVNGDGAAAATPTFAPKAGKYSAAQTVAISDAIPGAVIYYTTDGSTPTTSSPVYSAPITVSSTETLKADALASGYRRSLVAAGTYTIN
jgi:hypothetical protein